MGRRAGFLPAEPMCCALAPPDETQLAGGLLLAGGTFDADTVWSKACRKAIELWGMMTCQTSSAKTRDARAARVLAGFIHTWELVGPPNLSPLYAIVPFKEGP